VSDFCEHGSEHGFHNMLLISRVGEEIFAFQEAFCTEVVSYTVSWSVCLFFGWLLSLLGCH
jgi:hypothetical protein